MNFISKYYWHFSIHLLSTDNGLSLMDVMANDLKEEGIAACKMHVSDILIKMLKILVQL